MDLTKAIRVADKAVKRQCHVSKWTLNDDVLQEARIRVWLKIRDGEKVTAGVIRGVARYVVIDQMRAILGRSSPPTKTMGMAKSEWDDVEAGGESPIPHPTLELDFIEKKLGWEDKLIFRHLRHGHSVSMISKAMGMSESTTHRAIRALMEKARGFGRRTSGEEQV